ncbi:MAG: TraB/GumN family protein [Spirochaetota bacterium]
MKPQPHVRINYLSPIEVQIDFFRAGELPAEELAAEATERRIFLLGTAHVSAQSARQTEDKIRELEPDCICVELDRQRYEALRQKERWQNLDLFKTLKEGKGFLLLINLLLAAFQKRIGRDLAIKPGQEMILATELAAEKNIHLELVDRPVEITLKRSWENCNFWGRCKLLYGLLASLFEEKQISEEDIENLKEADSLEHLMEEFSAYLPSIKVSLIDERDVFLARSIAAAAGKNVFAVLGAGHLRGVCHILERVLGEEGRKVSRCNRAENAESAPPDSGQTEEPAEPDRYLAEWLQNPQSPIPQNEELLHIPAKALWRKCLPWFIPALAAMIMASGFFFADTHKALQGIGIWVVSHSVLAGLAALLVWAHPLSILAAVLTSPFTSLNPTISVGLVTALTEVFLRKPRVKDIENLLELEKWWQFRSNRIWHALIIFIVVSLGGSAATFIALPWLSVLFST